jgi:thiamine biosynthesis lipoprotein
MNTRVDIILCDKKEEEAKRIAEAIYKQLYKLEKTGNYYDPLSELSTINNAGYNTSVVVSADLFSMIKMCLTYHEITAGYFDITIHSDNHTIDTIKSVSISEKDLSITLNKKGIRLNLSAFIKGYALDAVKNILEKNRINNALINIGNSSVLTMGNHPFGDGWKIGIDFPTTTNERKEITLKNKNLTTSGNNIASRKHIISPHTGKYIEGVKGVSVITDTAMDGEVLSTALFAAEPEKRLDILRHFNATIYNL